MQPEDKKLLKALVLEIRHTLEGWHDQLGVWQLGDVETRLASLGVRRDRDSIPVADLPHLAEHDVRARETADAFVAFRREAGETHQDAVAELVRETAHTWANRLLALRCMEARELIDEVVLQKPAYGGRSLEHHRLAQRRPDLCAGEDDGLFAALGLVFEREIVHLPRLFDPQSPGIALRPSPAALRHCVALLSGVEVLRGQQPASDAIFAAPDALGWAYQFWNTEAKDRVFERVRTEKGAKIEGADIIPATQLYTEDYMVKFLVQNSLGATWMCMHPDSDLADAWEYYVRDADRTAAEPKAVRDITFLDPACGSGHFHLEAFDLLYSMYEEEEALASPDDICASILENNLFGIDIDERAVQIAEAALWMKAAQKAPGFRGVPRNLVAANIRLPHGRLQLEAFLAKHPDDTGLRPALETIFSALEHADEIGSLLQIEEPVDKRLQALKEEEDGRHAAFRAAPQGVLFDACTQPRLPMDVLPWDEWKLRTLQRLADHFEAEAEAADLTERLFGANAGKGLKLFALLSRRYEVVTANPPWMGSNNMGPSVASYLDRYYSEGKRDLYAAFMLRCLGVCAPSGRVAMVTQQSWLTLRSFAGLRVEQGDRRSPTRGLLQRASIESLVQLGRYAFAELGNAVIQPVLFVLCAASPVQSHRIFTMRLKAPRLAEEQAGLIRSNARCAQPGVVNVVLQARLAALPDGVCVFWLPEHVLSLVVASERADVELFISKGIDSCNQSRFMRAHWEVADVARFLPYAKGGTHCRWYGLNWYCIDWERHGARVKRHVSERHPIDKLPLLVQHEGLYGRENLTYSAVAQGSMGARYNERWLFSGSGPGMVWRGDGNVHTVLSLLNSRVSSLLLRGLTAGGLTFFRAYVERLPITTSVVAEYEERYGTELAHALVAAKRWVAGLDPCEASFVPRRPSSGSLLDFHRARFLAESAVAAHVLSAEARNDERVFRLYGFGEAERRLAFEDLGTPSGYHPCIEGIAEAPPLPNDLMALADIEPCASGGAGPSVSRTETAAIRSELEAAYVRGRDGATTTDDEAECVEDDDEDRPVLGAQVPVPAEYLIEVLSQRVQVHPCSVYWLVRGGIEKDGWRCWPEERQFVGDYIAVMVLRLLGHRWPLEIYAGDGVPGWSDPDGIIPVTDLTEEASLIDRVRERMRAEFEGGDSAGLEREFAEVMDCNLEEWLGASFFRQHISRFKKRPIAWHVQSNSPTPRRQPAFACLLYYHRLDGITCSRLQSQYVRPLRARLETELRGIEAVTERSRSARQQDRQQELERQIPELTALDEALGGLAASGFCPPGIRPRLRQYALDDAMLSLKAQWLRRLVRSVSAGPLPGWCDAAANADLHDELAAWIADAMAHLDHHCSAVGPAAPRHEGTLEDPTSSDLALGMAPHAAAMVRGALALACNRWWKQLDEAVLSRFRKQIRELRDEVKGIARSHADGVGAVGDEIRRRTLKQDLKRLERELQERTGRAQALRKAIEDWTCPEAAGWESWLASQPLYGHIASPDGKRPAPSTVAAFIAQESAYVPDLNDGVRVNIAPLQRARLLAADVLAPKDVDKAIADRADWRADERRWCREGKLPQPGWWPEVPQ